MNPDSTSPAPHGAAVYGLARQLRQSQDRYRLVVKLGRVVNSSLDLRKVFRHAARGIRPLFHCDRISLLLVNDGGATYSGFTVEYGDEPRWVDEPCRPLHGSAAESVLRQRHYRLVELNSASTIVEDRQLFDRGYRAVMELPLFCRERGVGVLGLACRSAERSRQWDLELLAELGTVLAIALDNAAAYTQVADLQKRLERENTYLREEVAATGMMGLIGHSAVVREMRAAVVQVAPTSSTVLILGETGVGKELVARAIHDLSPRREQLLVKVNCAALAPGTITSELFGHEAGAFTGALKQRAGRFELAHGGSLFLDEIAEMPLEAQVLLLRVLQERVVERVGGQEPIAVDVRLLAATNRDLTAAVREQRFRADLFYRLNVFPLRVPPLRERRDDIPALVEHFLRQLRRRVNKPVHRVGARTLEQLASYHWPGNVRELENIVERGLIVSTGDTLEIDPTWLAHSGLPDAAAPSLADQERRAIVDALGTAQGRVYGPSGAAAMLGLKPTTLYGKMRKHGIRKRATAE